jgi:outer membrane protease
MDDQGVLIMHYLPLVNAELQRIGFTEDDFSYLGSGGEFTRTGLEAHLAELRDIPSGIGAIAYYARYGVDFAAIKRQVDERATDGGAT